MLSHQKMVWAKSALQVCLVSALCHHLNSKTRHIFTVSRLRVIKPTPLVTGPLEVARLGETIQSVLQILKCASVNVFSQKLLVLPKLLK